MQNKYYFNKMNVQLKNVVKWQKKGGVPWMVFYQILIL